MTEEMNGEPGGEMRGELRLVVEELERDAAAAGWDRPARLFALVPTAELLAREPGLREVLADASALTPVQQDEVDADRLEEFLQSIGWPDEVAGCAAVLERLVLPPGADDQVPEQPGEAASYAATHPDRQEVRIVAAVTRSGDSWCTLRLRAHDNAEDVLASPDLVPGLIGLLRDTLDPDDE